MVNKIFSLKYEDFNGKIYKVFYILGLKIKFFSLKRTLKDHIKKNRRFENIINEYIGDLCKSLVTLLCEINNSSELICIQSESIVFILSKYFFNCDKQFIFDFLSFDFLIMKQTPVITSLNKNCPLYKEHFEKLKTIGGGGTRNCLEVFKSKHIFRKNCFEGKFKQQA